MSESTEQLIRTYFEQALDLPSAQRESFLREQIDDEAVRREIRTLIEAYDSADDFLEQSPVSSDVSIDEITKWANPDAQLVGETIGTCRLERVIASGGMGTVYEAQQAEPKRRVAVKLMRRRLQSKHARRRFEYETQVLAQLRHPGIAQILEAGTQDGDSLDVPYFVMEYIEDAKALTMYARDQDLSLRARIELFIEICEAVHHGHLRGVIHRDLKPENILVDREGRPRIIDFGVAKATDQDLAISTLITETGQLVGTLQYMSPEQCHGEGSEIDLRSDVYSLGVILYELLCDQLPYELTSAKPVEALRIVREQGPRRPSDTNRTLRGDLDTIVLKALAKEPARRYVSAAALAADLQRYLDNEPIAARPPSIMYQLRKLARRNTGLVAGVMTAVIALIIGFGVAIWKNVQLGDAMADLSATNLLLVEQEKVAVNAQVEAERRAESLEQVNGLIDDIISGATPVEAQGEELTVAQMLEAASEKIDQEPPEDALVEASMHFFVGQAFSGLGRLAEAETHLREAMSIRAEQLGSDSYEALEVNEPLASVLQIQGSFEEAESLSREALAYCKSSYGAEHERTLNVLNNLGLILLSAGKTDEGLECIRTVLETRRRLGVDLGASLHNYAMALGEAGRYIEALPVLRESLDLIIAQRGELFPGVLAGRNNLAQGYIDQGLYEEAEREFRLALDGAIEVFGPEDWRTNMIKGGLTTAILNQGRPDEAEQISREIYESSKQNYGPEHPQTLEKLLGLGLTIQKTDRWRDAEVILREVVEASARVLGDQHSLTARSLHSLAAQLLDQKEYEESERMFKRAIEFKTNTHGLDNPNTLTSQHIYGTLLIRTGRAPEAIELLTGTLQGRIEALGDAHPNTRSTRFNLAEAYRAVEDFAAAVELYETQFRIDQPNVDPADPRITELIQELIATYEEWGQPDHAAEWRTHLPDSDAD